MTAAHVLKNAKSRYDYSNVTVKMGSTALREAIGLLEFGQPVGNAESAAV